MSEEFSDINSLLSSVPQDVQENLPYLLNRVNTYLAYYAAANLSRLKRLMQFLQKVEERLYDDELVDSYDIEDIQKLYKSAKSASNEILDFARRVSAQVEANDCKFDELSNILKSLSPDQIEELKRNIDGVV